MEDQMRKNLSLLTVISALVIVAACTKSTTSVSTGKPYASATVNNLSATLSNSTGQLKQGDQEVMLAFNDATGKAVDVGAVSLNFQMPAMGSMAAMNEAVTFTTTETPGVYRGRVNIPHAGEWQAQLAFEGPAGKGKTTFSVTAR
jgi:hypothetical protein